MREATVRRFRYRKLSSLGKINCSRFGRIGGRTSSSSSMGRFASVDVDAAKIRTFQYLTYYSVYLILKLCAIPLYANSPATSSSGAPIEFDRSK